MPKHRYSKAASKKIGRVMGEFYDKTLKHGGTKKKVVRRDVAQAIALSEARRKGYKVPPKKKK